MASEPSAKGKHRSHRLGKYQVLAHIATGGMGAVYKAKDTELNREVALKILPPELASRPGMIERFHQEARHAARLRHENIVTLYEFGEEKGTFFLALEFVEGIDLHDYINKKKQLDPKQATEILTQATRALDHAHQQGIVHRDIKPSNFLLMRQDGRLVVKLTDLGLALAPQTEDEDARVTKSGTTVGTIDYISPEQARDSRAADIRSDIYSLGCTFYHMLAGQAPFADGSLTERIFKHIEAEPPDIGTINPRVPDSLRALLRRMMAKKPEDRYQTPAELLADLERVDDKPAPLNPRDLLLALAGEEEAEQAPKKPRKRPDSMAVSRPPSTPARRPASVRRRRPIDTDDDDKPAAALPALLTLFGQPIPPSWIIGGAVIVGIVLVVAIGIVFVRSGGQHEIAATTPQPVKTEPPPRTTEAEIRPVIELPKPVTPPKPEGPPRLYTPAVPLDARRLREEVEAPWAAEPAPPADAHVYRIGRLALFAAPRSPAAGPPMGIDLGSASSDARPQFASLADACAAAPTRRTTILEIDDNGPFFQPPLIATGKDFVFRAGKGFRPLLVWNTHALRADNGVRSSAFITLNQGSLTLENLDVAVQAADSADPPALFRITDGNFRASGCTFSVAGKQRNGFRVVRLDGDRMTARHCRLSNCVARGASLVALDVLALGANVLLDGCLVVGGEEPLLQVAAVSQPTTHLKLVRSTLVARQTLLQVRQAVTIDDRPAVDCLAWDCLLARSNRDRGGELVALTDSARLDSLHWRPINALYAGWQNLCTGPETIPATDLPAWHRRWAQTEGDKALAETWPLGEMHDPAEVAPASFDTMGPLVGYAATAGPGLLGCDLAALPPTRDRWLALTHERFVGPAFDPLTSSVPPIPPADPQVFRGTRLDLTQIDPGVFLEQMAKMQPLAPQVVLHLAGRGQCRTHPIRLKGHSLVLYFEPSPEKTETLTLIPSDTFSPGHDALIEVEDGDLDIIGGNFRCPDFKTALLPPYLLKVRGGNLRLHGCRLQGPLAQPPDAFQALIQVVGSGKSDPEKASLCVIGDSVLLSGRAAIQLSGSGIRLSVQQSVLVCGAEALQLQPGATTEPRLNVHATLEGVTIAARRAVVLLGDVPGVAVPQVPLVVQTKSCAFLNPFSEPRSTTPARAGLLLAAGQSLSHGMLVWQSEGDVYDKRLYFQGAAADGPLLDQPQVHALWGRLWGPLGDVQPIADVAFRTTLDFDKPQLERLALPPLPRFQARQPGADLVRLGILKKR